VRIRSSSKPLAETTPPRASGARLTRTARNEYVRSSMRRIQPLARVRRRGEDHGVLRRDARVPAGRGAGLDAGGCSRTLRRPSRTWRPTVHRPPPPGRRIMRTSCFPPTPGAKRGHVRASAHVRGVSGTVCCVGEWSISPGSLGRRRLAAARRNGTEVGWVTGEDADERSGSGGTALSRRMRVFAGDPRGLWSPRMN